MEIKLEAEREADERKMQHDLQIEQLKSETSLERSKLESTILEHTNQP